MIARLYRPLVMGLLPVALIACMSSPPTSAEPIATVPLGFLSWWIAYRSGWF